MARSKAFDERSVLRKALHRFWCRGYEATSTRDLVEAMGISHGSVYNAYQGKEGLYYEALVLYIQENFHPVLALLASPEAPPAQLQAFFKAVLAEIAADQAGDNKGCLMANAALEVAPHNPAVRVRLEAAQQQLEHALQQVVLRGQQRGDWSAAVDATTYAQAVVNALSGFRVRSKTAPDTAAFRAVADLLLGLLKK